MSTCTFHRSEHCSKSCVDDFHREACKKQCTKGQYEQSVCSTTINCYKDHSCFIEIDSPCIKKTYRFNIFDICVHADSDAVLLATCGARTQLKLRMEDMANVCSSLRCIDSALADCSCTSCQAKYRTACLQETFTHCSCHNLNLPVDSGQTDVPPTRHNVNCSHIPTIQPTRGSVSMTTDGPSSLTPSIIGGAVAGVVVIILAILLIFMANRYRRKIHEKKTNTRSKAFQNQVYEPENIDIAQPASLKVYDERRQTVMKQNNTEKSNVQNLGFEDDSEYNVLHKQCLVHPTKGGDEQYDHVKDFRKQPDTMDDYDELNKFSKITDNYSSDDYDHCRTVYINQSGDFVETPDDDYDHCRKRGEFVETPDDDYGHCRKRGEFVETPDDDYDHCSKRGEFVETPDDDYGHCKTVNNQQRGKSVKTPDDDYDHFR